MVSIFEGIALGLAFVGLGVPAWIFSIAIYHAAKKPRKDEPSSRYFAYSRVMDRLLDEMNGETKRAPVLVATIRELRHFPEYSDISVLYLEEITVYGDQKFDRVVEKELKETEAHLLDSKDD